MTFDGGADITAIPTPAGSCHVLKSLVDSHPELLVSMVLAARHEWLAAAGQLDVLETRIKETTHAVA
jgi:hypothetical protein